MASEQRGLPTSAFMAWCYPRQQGEASGSMQSTIL
jgi:hypothetical protein